MRILPLLNSTKNNYLFCYFYVGRDLLGIGDNPNFVNKVRLSSGEEVHITQALSEIYLIYLMEKIPKEKLTIYQTIQNFLKDYFMKFSYMTIISKYIYIRMGIKHHIPRVVFIPIDEIENLNRFYINYLRNHL